MKINKDKILFWSWTLLVLVIYIIIIAISTKAKEYNGTNINLTVNSMNDILSLNSDSNSTIQAASSDFFLMRNQNGDIVYGIPGIKPLGWDKKYYFLAGPITISDGKWIIEQGSFALNLTNIKKMNLLVIQKNWIIALKMIAIFIVTLLVWVFVIATYNSAKEKSEINKRLEDESENERI